MREELLVSRAGILSGINRQSYEYRPSCSRPHRPGAYWFSGAVSTMRSARRPAPPWRQRSSRWPPRCTGWRSRRHSCGSSARASWTGSTRSKPSGLADSSGRSCCSDLLLVAAAWCLYSGAQGPDRDRPRGRAHAPGSRCNQWKPNRPRIHVLLLVPCQRTERIMHCCCAAMLNPRTSTHTDLRLRVNWCSVG